MAGELAKDIEPKTRADAPKVAAEARVEEVQPPESAMKAAPEGLSNTSGLKLSSLVKDYYEIALQSQQAKEAAKDPKDKAAADKEQKKEDPKETLKKIEQEIAEGTLGPNSLKAAKIISDWFVEQLIPNVISQLKQQGVPIPGQGPFNVPESLRQDSQGGESFLNSLASGAIKSDFLTAGRSKEESDRLDNTFVGRLSSGFDWLSRADRAAGEMQRAKQEQFLTDEITKLFTDSKGNVSEPEKLKAWLDKDSIAGGDWGRVAKERVELFKSVKEYVYAQYQLHESNPKTPFEPPPGIIIKKRADGEIDIDFDKTKDLLPARPEAKEQAESWQKWLKEWTPKIDSARSEYVNALQDSKENQGTKYILSFQELPFQDSVVRLNDKGEVQKILKASEAQAGDKPFNLADTDMTIRRVVGEDGKETIYVKPQLQLRETKIYNYLDLGAAAVGKPMDLPEREFKPKDFVAVNDGGKPKLIQAQDLENWLTWQKVFHRGEKVVMAAMDATMVVSGTIEFGAALKAGTEAASHIGWGLYHASLGATGVINNAYFKESEAGRIANQVRGTLFLVGGGVDLAKWGLGGVYRGAYRMMGGAAEEASLSQATIAMQKQLENTSWAVLSDHAGRVGSWAGVAFVPLAYEGAARSVHDLMDAINGTPDYMGQAIKDLKDKKIFLKSPDSGAGQEKKLGPTEELQKLRTQISGDSSNAASSILAKAIELSKNPDKKDEIEKFKSELINYFKPDKDKIVSLGIDRKLADERAGGYWKYRAGQDRQAQVAAAMALIQLSRTPDGNLPTVLAQRELQIPAYNQHQASSSRTYSLVKPEVEKQSVSLTDIATALRANLNDKTTSEASALLSIQSGDMLLAMRSASGFSGQDYAEKLSKIATDKSQGDIPRAQAIIRLSEIASALRVQEQFTQQPTISKPGSVSSSSIEQLLTNLVRDTNEQANVRSMAAALNFANILGKDHGERTRIAQYFSDKYQKDGKVSAEFNDFVSNSIQNLLVNEKSDSAKQIAAARVLLDLGVSIKINQLSPNANAIEQSIQNARMLKASEWIETKSGKYTSNPFAEVLGFSGKSTATDIAAFKSALQVQADNAKALQIMDKLAGLTSREEKEVFKKELMGYFLPSGKDIAEGSTGPAVSDKNAQLAAAMGLLFLAKEAGDLSPVNLGRRTVDVPAHYEKQAASDEGGNTYDRNVFVPASKSEQSLGAEQVFAALKAGMTDKNAPLLALTETMIFAGRLSGEELFGSLRDLAGDPNRSTNERAQALLRLAQLSSTMQFRSEMTAGRAAELVGSGRKDAIAVMQKLIQDPQTDGQLKALSASLLQLQMEPKYEDRNRILGELNTKLQSSSPAEFGASVREYLAREIKGADVERSLFASTAMKNLYDASKDQLNLSRSSLAGIVGGGDLSLAVRAMKELSSQDLSSLAAGDKLNLVDNLIKDCAYFTNSGKFLPKDLQLKMAELVKTIPSVAAIANDRQKQALESSLQALSNKGKIWTEPQLRAEAIKALQELGSQSSIPMFDQFIAGMPGDPNSRETSIQVREAALKAALAIDPLIRSKVSEWVKLEKDPVMLQRMQDVLSVSADSRSRAGFEGILPSDLIKRYPKSNELYGQTIPAADKELAAHKTAIDLLEKVQAIKAGDPSVSRDELIAKIFNIFRPDAAGIVNQEQSGVYHYYELEKAGFESFQGSTPDVVKKAAAMALLELTRREDGSNPDLLLQRSVDVPGFQKDVPNATDPMGAPLSNVTEYVEARKVDQRISRDEIMALLSKKDSTTILDRTDIKAASYDGYLLNNTELLPAEKFLQILKTDSDDSSKKQLAGNLMLDNWLKSVFERPLLNERSYQKIRQEDSAKASLDAYAGVSGMTKEIFSSSETIKQQRDLAFNKKLDELAHQRLKQIDKLTEIALKGGADGLMAKIAISQALQSSKIYAGGDDEFRLKAAKAVKTLLTASADVDVIQRAAADALKNNSESLSVEAQGVLLKALMENNNASSLPRSQLAETVLTGLESLVRTSSSKLDEKSAKLANDYIDALESLAYRPASDLMQRINKDYAGTALAERASKFLEKTTESTESAWADAAVDKLSTAKTRALIFEKQLSSTSSNDEIVKMIASTVKGLPIQGADDPRLPILQKEMDSQDDRVKIAASRAIIESQKAEFPAFLQAKELLAKFALSTTNATLRREALTALGKLNN